MSPKIGLPQPILCFTITQIRFYPPSLPFTSSHSQSISPTNWGWLKGIKTGNKVRVSGESINKRAITYTAALVNEARIRKEAKERIDAKWCSMMFSYNNMFISSLVPSFGFDLQLENWGVDVNELKAKTVKRVFRAWVEEWEKECIKDKDAVVEVRSLGQYKGIEFFDPEDKITYTIE